MDKKQKWIVNFIIPVFCTILGAVLTHIFNIHSINYERMLEVYQENRTHDELLIEAERYYKMGEVGKTFQIYELDVLDTNPIAISNLAYLYENGIFVAQDVIKAKELYDKASKLGNIEAVDNWTRFNIKYPGSLRTFISDLQIASNMGSEIPSKFVLEFFEDVDEGEKILKALNNMNDKELWDILVNRVYEEEVNDEIKDLLGKEFIIETNAIAKSVKVLIGTDDYYVDTGEEKGELRFCKKAIPLYGKNIKSEIWYNKYVFLYAKDNPTQFIYIEEGK